MTSRTFAFTGGRGEALHAVEHAPPGPPVAVFAFHHGYGEHSGRTEAAWADLANAGVLVRTYDCVNHGRSVTAEADKGLVPSFQWLVDDFTAFAADAAGAAPGAPLFVGGHSMGGLVATLTAVAWPGPFPDAPALAGLILCSAAVNIEWTPILRIQAPLGGLLAALAPRARIVPAVNPEHMSSDPELVRAYLADPLNFVGKVRARTGNELLKAFRVAEGAGPKLTLPLLAIHGDADRLASLPAVRALVAGASSSDASIVVFPGGYHELLTGPERADAVRAVREWLLDHAAGARGGSRGAKM